MDAGIGVGADIPIHPRYVGKQPRVEAPLGGREWSTRTASEASPSSHVPGVYTLHVMRYGTPIK